MLDVRPGDRVRLKRASEMLEPEWYLDHSSQGRYYVDYGRKVSVSIDILGEEYIVYMVSGDTIWMHNEWQDANGNYHRDLSFYIPRGAIAEILGKLPQEPRCNCGKTISGSVGPHSYWCNVAQGYTGG